MTYASLVLCAGLYALSVSLAFAQTFPTKPIRIVTVEPAGSADIIARLIANSASPRLGQPVIVENRGGNVVIPAMIVAKAPADGYTLLIYGGTFWVGPLMEKAPYDPI